MLARDLQASCTAQADTIPKLQSEANEARGKKQIPIAIIVRWDREKQAAKGNRVQLGLDLISRGIRVGRALMNRFRRFGSRLRVENAKAPRLTL